MHIWQARFGDVEDLIAPREPSRVERGARHVIDRTVFPSLGGGPWYEPDSMREAMTEILALVDLAEELIVHYAESTGTSVDQALFSLAGLGKIVETNHSGQRPRGE